MPRRARPLQRKLEPLLLELPVFPLVALQQAADQATFERRALAVEKERAIADNELKNQVELARRAEELIAQRGQNERHRVQEDADAKRIQIVAQAERTKVEGDATANAKAEAERVRLDGYRDPSVATCTTLTDGEATERQELEVTSGMNYGGVVFGDGIEADHLVFGWGMHLRVGIPDRKLELVRA